MPISTIILYVLGISFLLFCSSFFSGSETALSALSMPQIQRLKRDKNKSSRAIIRFIDEPRRLFITVLLGNTLVNMAFVSITGALLYNDIFRGKNPVLAYVTAIILETSLLLVFGEVTPKTYAIYNPEKLAKVIASPLWFFSLLIFPFRKALRFLTDLLLPLFGVKTKNEQVPLTTEEIRAIITSTEKHGALQEVEGKMIHNIFELRDIDAREIMIPRTRIVRIRATISIKRALALTKKFGHSRLPVIKKNIDDICGIFYVKDWPRWKGMTIESMGGKAVEDLTIEEFLAHKDLLNSLNPDNENTLIRTPHYSISSKKIGALILEMTRQKQQMAILLDEYGGVDGLVTVEDIVEEVVGEMIDEYDKASELTIAQDKDEPSALLIPGYVGLRSMNKRFGLKFDLSQADTIGGYVISLHGSIPVEGEVISDKTQDIEFKIKRMDGTRIDLIQAKIKKKDKPRKTPIGSSLIFLLFPLCLLFMGTSTQAGGLPHPVVSISIFALLLLFSLLLLAFYAGSETAVVSASKPRIEVLAQQKNHKAILIQKLWKEPDRMMAIILVGTNLMATAAGVAGLRLMSAVLPGKEGLQEILNTVFMTLIILIFCEILPKTVFRAKADTLALRSAQGLWISGFVLRPVVSATTKITNSIVRMASGGESKESLRAKREELKLLAKMGEEGGALRRDQLQMIYNVLGMERMSIEKVMTPLVDIVCLPSAATLEDFYKTAAETGYSRIPVYEGRVDNMIGLVNILDVLYDETPAATIAPYVRKDVRHEPETKRVYSLLRELGQGGPTMAFVVDEFGGVVGLVTTEDLIEEILGDIWDEKDREEANHIIRLDSDIFECDGKAEIQHLNHRFNLSLPTGNYKTIAGFIISHLDRIPLPGEHLETDKLKISIIEADEKSIKRVRIILKDQEQE